MPDNFLLYIDNGRSCPIGIFIHLSITLSHFFIKLIPHKRTGNMSFKEHLGGLKQLDNKKTPIEPVDHPLRLYGNDQATYDLLHHQLEHRQYFDSGDSALSRARRSSDVGIVTTGKEHPARAGISHPSCPVPSSSNVDEHAWRQEHGGEKAGRVQHHSLLHE
ncbi:hypothetical protein BKA67DRAFT_570298 [Truncatella angustata]|uniref:mRNA stability protein n=1 Tax=Truncatella angustata TaxID=152316 RepID=A0A9P8ZWZ7_9PEZI|nr:uncharacterized protein BKA67DRAFT_570298 [Truncatella angustata]KAH6653566.1 hypothetical protein BKA67DRAFT_570298 [Truncatella angustata]